MVAVGDRDRENGISGGPGEGVWEDQDFLIHMGSTLALLHGLSVS